MTCQLWFSLFLKCVQRFGCSSGNLRHRGGGPEEVYEEVVLGQLLPFLGKLVMCNPEEVSEGLVPERPCS